MSRKIIWLLVPLMAAWVSGCGQKGPDTPHEDYTAEIPELGIEIEMVFVPGGEFTMGATPGDENAEDDEKPPRTVKVDPFWISRYEVTWEQYDGYAFARDPYMLDAISIASPKINRDWGLKFWGWLKLKARTMFDEKLDAITHPSPFYGDHYHGMGRGPKPMIAGSRLNAMVYAMWLSKKTGCEFRLPTEAEWEYAARAGSESVYCFGDDPSELDDYAWYADNSDFETMDVGTKKPNAWGIHDMHGNVWEFCQDMYDPDYFDELGDGVSSNPMGPDYGTEGYKAVARGGSWDDFPEELRVSNRLEQPDWWNERDPQRPRGTWWLVDGDVVGFRVVRPAN